MAVQFAGRFTKTFLDNPADGTYTDRTGLYLAVRNGGKAQSWSFRHRGKRKTIGSALRIPLDQAQERVQQFKAKLKAGEDPMAPISHSANVWSFVDEGKLFYAHKCEEEWHDDAAKLGKSMIKNYIENTAYAKTPLTDIGVGEMVSILKPTWNKTPVFAKRAALMIGQMIDLAQIADPPRYPADKKNPVDLTARGPLCRQLGKQRLGGHRLGLPPQSISKLVAHLYEPLFAHGPDECTTAEAAEAIGCDKQAILIAHRKGKLKGGHKIGTPYDYRNATWVFPIAELKKAGFRFRKEPRQHAEVGPHANVLLFLIYTAVRSDMACGLLWTEVKWEDRGGIIDFGKRHKMATRNPEAEYTIPITPEVKALLEAMREKQRRDGTNTPFVFVHSPTRVGVSHYRDKPVNPNTVNTYFKRCLVRLDLVNGETNPRKMPSVHGFRNTFPEWASDLNEIEQYKLEYIEAQLGHWIKVNNRMYYRNVTYLRHRRAMMSAWEQYCRPTPDVKDSDLQKTADNVRWLGRKRSA